MTQNLQETLIFCWNVGVAHNKHIFKKPHFSRKSKNNMFSEITRVKRKGLLDSKLHILFYKVPKSAGSSRSLFQVHTALFLLKLVISK